MTPKLSAASAIDLLDMHERTAHVQDSSVTSSIKSEKFPRHTVLLDEPIEKWEEFRSSWQQYNKKYCLSGKKLTK